MQRNVRTLTHQDIHSRAYGIAVKVAVVCGAPIGWPQEGVAPASVHPKIYPIPRGGVPAAYAVGDHLTGLNVTFDLVNTPEEANVFVDDVIDSGETCDLYLQRYNKPFFALYDKINRAEDRQWLIFPWEHNVEQSTEDIFVRLLQYIGEDPKREGLRETPARMARAWAEWTSGYGKDPKDICTMFDDVGSYDEMVVVRDIPFYSHCEHHLAPFFGTVTVGYIPGRNGRVVGLSKLGRVVGVYAQRLQVQERLTEQLAESIRDVLEPKGVGVIVKARHLCMESRGLSKQGHETVTTKMLGVFMNKPATRAEFLAMAQ